jgi:hypothetical protein
MMNPIRPERIVCDQARRASSNARNTRPWNQEIGKVFDRRPTHALADGELVNRSPMSKTEIPMTKRPPRSQPTWTDVKAKLASLDRMALTGLIQDLYAADRDNQTFLHTRFGLGEDVLKPYKKKLDRWLWPDVLRNQKISVANAKQAISSYRKAVGEPSGLAELMVSYCESAVGFSNEVGYHDEGYFDALVKMFEQALKVICQLPETDRDALIVRLEGVRTNGYNLGYGAGDEMDSLFADFVPT